MRPSESATNVLSLHTLLSITQQQCKAQSKLRQQSSNCIIYSLGTSINVKVRSVVYLVELEQAEHRGYPEAMFLILIGEVTLKVNSCQNSC